MEIVRVTEVTDEIVEAFKFLTPQLSSSSAIPGREQLAEMGSLTRNEIVRAMAAKPEASVAQCAQAMVLGHAPERWQDRAARFAGTGLVPRPRDDRERRMRFAMGLAMRELRGRVAAADVATELSRVLGMPAGPAGAVNE